MDGKKNKTEYRACNLCEAICGLAIETDGERILSIRGDGADPFSQGHICPKAVALQDIHEDPDRLRYPQRRTRGGWQRMAWNDAFDEVAERLRKVQLRYGNDAVGVYQGNPTVHNSGTLLSAPHFVRALRTRNRFSATSVDQLPHQFASYFMFGHQLLLPVPDIDRTQFFLILGANPLASNGSMMTAPGFGRRLKALQSRGGKFVVIDPRRTETAELADEHHFVNPGTDALLLLALLHTLFSEELVDGGRLHNLLDGLSELRELVADFSPDDVSQIVGIGAKDIRRLAVEFATAESAVCYGRVGVSTQSFGATNQWLINVLNALTGNLDEPGGAMFTNPAIELVKRKGAGSFARWSSRVRGLPEFAGELPVSVLAEEILVEGEGQIRALVTSAGNPVLSTPNGRQLARGLGQLEFMVSIDIYVNETTRYADIILPPTCGLETDHYDLVFHLFGVRNTARYNRAIFQPAQGTKHDWQIFRELRKRLIKGSARGGVARRLVSAFMNSGSPERVLDLGLRLGPYGVWGGRLFSRSGLSISRLKREPHGIDLGPLRRNLPERLRTSDGRIRVVPQVFAADIGRVRATFLNGKTNSSSSSFDLQLIGRRDLRSNNSWMHNFPRLVKGPDRCTLMMNPLDASERGLENQQTVELRSRVGKITLPLEVNETLMRGVVSVPHGWGHGEEGVNLMVARKRPGVSINDVTDDRLIDELSGNAAFSGVPVLVAAI